jgi:sec-independent protein translocase protein TatC
LPGRGRESARVRLADVDYMAKTRDDDLFKESVMTFGEHLEELRSCLIKAVFGLVIGVLIGFFCADWVIRTIQVPLEKALQQFYLGVAKDQLLAINPNASSRDRALVDERKMVFERVYIEPHAVTESLTKSYPQQMKDINFPATMITREDLPKVKELAKILVAKQGPAERIWSLLKEDEQKAVQAIADQEQPSPDDVGKLIAALNRLLDEKELFLPETLTEFKLEEEIAKEPKDAGELNSDQLRQLNWQLMNRAFPGAIAGPHPHVEEIVVWRPIENDPRTRSRSFGAAESFMIWLKAAFIAGFVIASPWVFYWIWAFVAAGLYPHEKKYVYVFMPFSIGLFLVGAATAFFFVFEPVLAFFFSFNRSLNIDPEPRISEWLSFVLFLPVGFGIAFQLPLVMLFLERINVMSVTKYLKQWRIAVLVIWVLAAILTPADPTSIFFLAVPLMFLYFGGILLCKWWPKKK